LKIKNENSDKCENLIPLLKITSCCESENNDYLKEWMDQEEELQLKDNMVDSHW
jgi:hypothetical protein